MEDAYVIKGGKPLKGEVVLSGAKNLALKAIIAALLFDSKVVLENVPRIEDVHEIVHLIQKLGVKADFVQKNTLEIDNAGLKKNKVDLLHASKTRVSFMLFAPLLHRFKECYIPNPGGCRIGIRPIDRIIDAMKKLGVEVVYNHSSGYYEAKMPKDPEGSYTFAKSTHTGTELLILLSALGSKKIVIENAAFEPEIDELIRFLNESGASVQRKGAVITIQGVSQLKQKKPFKIVADRNEAVTFATLAIATKGEVIFHDFSPHWVDSFIKAVKKANGGVDISAKKIRFYYKGDLKPVNIETAPHPGFMTDWQPNWAVLMTQADGESFIHERIFENRFSYVKELRKLGAKITFLVETDPRPASFYFFNGERKKVIKRQIIKIIGPRRLHNAVLSISDLRAGATLATASLVAHGESIVQGASIMERGYEDFEEKIAILGGEIKKV